MRIVKIAGEEKREEDFTNALEIVMKDTLETYEKITFEEIPQVNWRVVAGVTGWLKAQGDSEGLYRYDALSYEEMKCIKNAVFEMYLEN